MGWSHFDPQFGLLGIKNVLFYLDPKHVHEAVYERLSSDNFELLGPTDHLNQITRGLRELWAFGVDK